MHCERAATHDRETLRRALISSVDEALGEITQATIRQVAARQQQQHLAMLGSPPEYSSARLLGNSNHHHNNNHNNNNVLVVTPEDALLTYSPRSSYGVHSALLAQSLNLCLHPTSLWSNHNMATTATTTAAATSSDALWLAAASLTRGADPNKNKLLGAAELQARRILDHQQMREFNHHHHHHNLMQDSIQALLLQHQARSLPVVSVPPALANNNHNHNINNAHTATTHLFEVLTSPCPMPSPGRVAEAPSHLQQSTEYQVTRTLQALGSSIRRRTDPYVDCTKLALPAKYQIQRKATPSRGGVAEPFPEKLFRMLSDTHEQGWTDIVSFLPHGRSFAVHDPDRFVQQVMPRYFQQTKWSSFTRQLNLWGFLRVSTGRDVGCFYHELFLKGYPGLCLHMRRVGTSTSGLDRRKFKCKITQGGDPDFYAMESLR